MLGFFKFLRNLPPQKTKKNPISSRLHGKELLSHNQRQVKELEKIQRFFLKRTLAFYVDQLTTAFF